MYLMSLPLQFCCIWKHFQAFVNGTLLLLWVLQCELDRVGSKQVISQRNWNHVSHQILLLIQPDCFNTVWVQSLVKVQQFSLQQRQPTSSPPYEEYLLIFKNIYIMWTRKGTHPPPPSWDLIDFIPGAFQFLSVQHFSLKWPNEQSIVAALHTIT